MQCRDINELRTLLDHARTSSVMSSGCGSTWPFPCRRKTKSNASCETFREPTPRTDAPASCWWTARIFGLQPGSDGIFPDDLPPVVKDTIARLDHIIEAAE